MLVPMLAASALVPSILLVWYFHSHDANPEPAGVLWKTFFLGVLCVVAVLLSVSSLGHYIDHQYPDPLQHGVLDAVFTAAFPEEFFKFLVVTLYCSRHKEFDEPMDGIVYGAVASLGFATLENILYVASNGLGVAILRGLTAVPGHAAMGAIMGYYVGRARFGLEPKPVALAKAYFIPVLLHALYDAPLLSLNNGATTKYPIAGIFPFLAIAVLLFEVAWVRRLVGRLHGEQMEIIERTRAAALLVVHDNPPVVDAVAIVAATTVTVEPKRRVSMFVTMILLVPGAILATAGGLVVFGIAIAFATHSIDASKAGMTIFGAAIMSVPPLLIGLWLFRRGLKRIAANAAPTVTPALA